MKKMQAGFTLIELMIVVVVIGILISIAIPNYSSYVRRSAATEATADLSNMRIHMEQFYQSNRNYGATTVCGHDGTAQRVSFSGSTTKYTYACTLDGGAGSVNQSYLIIATGATGPAVGNSYTISSGNTKATTNYNGAASTKTCWLIKGDEC